MALGQRVADLGQDRRDDTLDITMVQMRIALRQPRHQLRFYHCSPPAGDPITIQNGFSFRSANMNKMGLSGGRRRGETPEATGVFFLFLRTTPTPAAVPITLGDSRT